MTKYTAALICRGSFPAELDEGGTCIVEVSVYRLNAIAAASFMLDGAEPLLLYLGLDEHDAYVTRHEIDDLVTIAKIIRKEPKA